MSLDTGPTVNGEPIRQPILALGWETIHHAVDILAHMIEPIKPKYLVGIARGGLVPATMIAHKLDLKLHVISTEAYEGTRRTLEKPIVVKGWQPEFDNADCVVIDDIMDTGDTFDTILYKASKGMLSKFSLFTIVQKQPCRFAGNRNFFMQVPKDVWVKFPWES